MYTTSTEQFPYIDEKTREDSTAIMCIDTSVYGSLRKELAMASLKNRRGKWYSRVLWYDGTGKKKEKQIPLKTESKVEARIRASQVEKHRNEIIELYFIGENYNFPWMNDEGILTIEYFNFENAVNEWLRLRKSHGIAETTVNRNLHSMNTFLGVLGRKIRLSEISSKSIECYADVMQQRGYKPHGININLRTLRTFLNWAFHRDYITKVPYFSMVRTEKSLPSYISDSDFAEIIKLDWINDHQKMVFQFYRDSGVRLSEPFIGKLVNSILVIPAKYSKSRMEKEIEINIQYLPILLEMQERYFRWKQKVKKPVLKYFTSKYSKVFKKCCRAVGIERRFHDLRHTFAVRRYLMTRDIYQVMKEMGHSKITTTQIYSKFNLRRLESDFPSLVYSYQKIAKLDKVDTKLVDTKGIYSS